MRLHEIITEGDPVADAQGSRINWDTQGRAIVPRDIMVKYQKLQQEDPEAWKKLSGWMKRRMQINLQGLVFNLKTLELLPLEKKD